jgi:hypothetical protein
MVVVALAVACSSTGSVSRSPVTSAAPTLVTIQGGNLYVCKAGVPWEKTDPPRCSASPGSSENMKADGRVGELSTLLGGVTGTAQLVTQVHGRSVKILDYRVASVSLAPTARFASRRDGTERRLALITHQDGRVYACGSRIAYTKTYPQRCAAATGSASNPELSGRAGELAALLPTGSSLVYVETATSAGKPISLRISS